MNREIVFNKSNAIGRKSEERVKAIFKAIYNIDFTERRDDWKYRNKDIDFSFSVGKDKKVYYLEVKHDSKIPNNDNFFFELRHIKFDVPEMDRAHTKEELKDFLSQYLKGKLKGWESKGWFWKCLADFLSMDCTVNHFQYTLDWSKTKDWLEARFIKDGDNFKVIKDNHYLKYVNFPNITDTGWGYGLVLKISKAIDAGLVLSIIDTRAQEEIYNRKKRINKLPKGYCIAG